MKILKSEDFLMVKKLKKYIKKYYLLIVLNMLLALVSSAVSVSPLGLIKRLVDAGILGSNEKDILYAAGGMICLAVIGAVLIYWNGVLSAVISSSIYKNITDDLYVKIQSLDMEYFSRTKVGELMVKVLNDPSNVNYLIIESFNMFSEAFKAIFCLAAAFYIDCTYFNYYSEKIFKKIKDVRKSKAGSNRYVKFKITGNIVWNKGNKSFCDGKGRSKGF